MIIVMSDHDVDDHFIMIMLIMATFNSTIK